MQIVYVLKSLKDNKWYIGCTSNMANRLEMHNNSKVISTKSRRPFIILHTENYNDKYEAFQKERYYKTAVGKRELKTKII